MEFEKQAFDCDGNGMEIQDMEPLPRERSNTWHGDFMCLDDRLQTFAAIPEKVTSSEGNGTMKLEGDFRADGDDEASMHMETSSTKKGSMRRNAWGNASYAELIAQAIEGSPEKRLTLTQIYEWMIKNIPYFQMKSDGPSSMGWKNEGTGKSSWWVVNRNFVKNKVPRRRATMGDSALMDRKRYRVNKKLKGQEIDTPPIIDEHTRKIRTISEANEVTSDNDHKFVTVLKKSSSQTIISSSLDNDSDEHSKSNKRNVSPEVAEQVLRWPEVEDVSGCMEESDLQNSKPHATCPMDSYAFHTTQQGSSAGKSHSIILRVQPQKNYFDTNISPPILFYVSSSEKNKLLLTTNQATNVEQSENPTVSQKPTQDSCGVSGLMLSDLNKQTNQMSLGDTEPSKVKSVYHISEKRRKMLMELLHSERFCQLRRQNPELNRKIIEMLQRKKNMLLKKNPLNNGILDSRGEQSFLDPNIGLQATQTFLPQSDWLKFNALDGSHPNVYSSNNESDSSYGKPESFVNSFEFGQPHNFQIDVDQTIGDIDFDGNIDDLFGTNCLLLNCEDELNILSHEFS